MRRILTFFVALTACTFVASAQAESTAFTTQMAQTAPASALSVTNYSEPTAPKAFPNIDIENFGQMDERFFRGSQPSEAQYKALKELGINTVIDLRKDNEDYSKSTVESLGMKYVHIPMTGWTTRDESVVEFLKQINDQANGKVYVHCAAGKHRTGLVGAVYRLENFGWDYDTAYKEMKNYEYFSGLFHRKIKSYVKKYYKKHGPEKQAAFKAAQAAKAAAAAAASTGTQVSMTMATGN
jgi:protein tyrosine/serine phosphatase